MPSSNACVERIFSFDLIKIENRNKLKLNTVESLISTRGYLKSNNWHAFNMPISVFLVQNMNYSD